MSTVDLKLLSILLELHDTRNVSHAAEHLGLNQSAVSMSLARLRKYFGDPLFVNTHRGMEPTPHASQIIGRLKEAHHLIRSAIDHRDTFVPATSNRTFRIAATDVGQVVVLPSLMNRLRVDAPSVAVEFTNFSEQSHLQLESGELDVALGFIRPLVSGFHRQKLFNERFVCVVRSRHPRIRRRLTREDFERESHLVVTTRATGHTIVEKTLEAMTIRRKVGLRLPNFIGVSALLENTDLLATVPERFARIIARHVPVRVFPTPIAVPSYVVMQYWHARSHREPASKWLRAVIVELFQERHASRSSGESETPPARG
ncbi:MAG: LysR family transcriptional regulator [Acidobacteriota bacterium]